MPSLSVEDPQIDEVLDLKTGAFERAINLIGDDRARLIQLRMDLQEAIARNEPRYVCAICQVPVYLVSLPQHDHFFFRHKIEDGGCPAKTRGTLSEREILALKFNGRKESNAHKRLKAFVHESLLADAAFTDVEVETVWKSVEGQKWRKPDVRARFRGLPVAFEIQLSTTFIRVIAERRTFYQQEGGLLFWIFGHFTDDDRRLTEDDVFYNNNRNAFVVTAETVAVSKATGAFRLDCSWTLPDDRLEAPLQRAQVAFAELTLEVESQRGFYFDYDTEAQRLRKEHEAAVKQKDQAATNELRNRLHRLVEQLSTTHEVDRRDWSQLRHDCQRYLQLPDFPSGLPRTLLSTLLSARAGKPVGLGFRCFVEVAHNIYPGHKNFLRYFHRAVSRYNTADRVIDRSGKWQKKVDEYKPLLKDRNPDFVADTTHLALLDFMFPELELRKMDFGLPLDEGSTIS